MACNHIRNDGDLGIENPEDIKIIENYTLPSDEQMMAQSLKQGTFCMME